MKEEIIERINSRKIVQGSLDIPPILDKDPVFAAEFLSTYDSKHYLDLLIKTYENLGQESQKNIALEELILYNRVNYKWFRTFTLTLKNLEGMSTEVYIPTESICDFRNEEKALVFIPPLRVVNKRAKPISLKVKDGNVISLNRALYIRECYSLADFRSGFPAWYAFSKTTIFEKYNPKTNKRVRIDFENGEFKYFLAGASDRWIRIVNVPLEMDSVVSALLFKN